jgi:N4-gp56 family major capsid protein
MPYYEPAPLGSSFNTVTSGVFIAEIWSTQVIRQRDESLVMKDMVSMIDFGGKRGDTIYIPYISNLAVNTKVAGSPVSYQSFTDRRWTMVVNRYKETSISLDELLQIQSQNDLRSLYTERAGFALARDIEYSILAERATINGYNSGSNVITSGTSLDYTDILAAHEVLDLANVPRTGRKLIISPKQYASLLTQPEFISADFNTGNAVSTGVVGNILGTPVKMTTSITVNSTTGYSNGEGAAGQPTPGMTSSPYYPTQTPALRDGTTVTASALTAGYTSALLTHPDWVKLAMVKMPSIDYEWSVDYQEHHIVQTQIYDCEAFRPESAVLINTTET